VADEARLRRRGREVDHAADDALGGYGAREVAARVEAFQPFLAVTEAQAIEEPPGHAVHRGDHAGLCAKHRGDGFRNFCKALGLDRD